MSINSVFLDFDEHQMSKLTGSTRDQLTVIRAITDILFNERKS